MIDLLMRRREMGLPPAPEPLPEYISDGLVLWLDGKVKGNTTDAWTDLVNGVVFTKKGGSVTFNSDNVQFGSSQDSCLYNTSTYEFVNSGVGTIEVCYREIPTSGVRTAFASCGIGSSGYGGTGISFQFYYGARIVFSTGNSGSRPYNGAWTAESTGTYSVSSARAIQNMVSKGFTSDRTYISRLNAAAVIGMDFQWRSMINGKIHSIRIYNRHLTEEEVLHNQAIDNTRFNLGLAVRTMMETPFI